ncbi:histidinol-phosphatase HisJ family protein [Agathobaculum sp.]|uniref:histidinol-phosphatase HisJ family protein n=1 Tax=Agathobaculum sp. TaxID=2048138 RepID=UPI002A7F754E|nr:histidinol-phosphatase HisJ family protein [Agathobaculum sp.]MDY3618286.1 histidinol-phosphatase HisJ family protein [Agathobaculum sp.]
MLVDLHMHTGYSTDAEPEQSVEQKVRACIARGIGIMAITDHLDFLHRRDPSDNRDVEACLRDIRAAKQVFADEIELLVGIEIGQVHADPRADAFLKSHSFDMVIGSLHVMPNDLDIYFHDFEHLDCDAFMQDYFDELLKIVRHGGFDVLAHIDYPLRVMRHGDYVPSFDQYMDRVSAVLRECISRGYALELNAAGMAGWQKKVGPPENILIEYKRLGGERISIGSDSHSLDTVGRGIEECAALAKSAGFSSVTVFRNRRAEQVEI